MTNNLDYSNQIPQILSMTLEICHEVKELRQAVQELKTEIADLKQNMVSPTPVTSQNLLPGVNAPADNGRCKIYHLLEDDRKNSCYGKMKQLTAKLIQWLVNTAKNDNTSIGIDTAKKLLKHANLIAKVTAAGMAGKMKEPVTWAGVPTNLRVTGYTYLKKRLVSAGIPLDKCVAFWCTRLLLCKAWESVIKVPSSTSESQHSTGTKTSVEVPADES
ncbi:hypothetical protein EC973_006068 [Apophysomyces ossiformis]|uniref:Uncharacterized protein n=1 Tax=Apophysomyces ossiformis TaxID=679940 RepID=A0A8H7BDH7_9FUNG|nr:hypothetical protein EC973_006068 [Apophysomyces ossiformis]